MDEEAGAIRRVDYVLLPILRSAEANKFSQDELRLMKTQDVKYIELKAQQEAKVHVSNKFI